MSEEIKNQCNCGCEEHEHDDVVMLEDENGNEVAFHYITTLEYEGKEYVFLQAAEGEDLDILEIYELETSEEDGEEMDSLYPVEDELYETLYNLFMAEVEQAGCDCDGDCDDDCDCGCHD